MKHSGVITVMNIDVAAGGGGGREGGRESFGHHEAGAWEQG